MRKPIVMERTLAGLHELVASAATSGDGRLPSERELSERFGVSQSTIKKALGQLKSDGLIDSRNGLGYFVLGRAVVKGVEPRGGIVGIVLFEEAHLAHPVAMARVRGVQTVLVERGYSTAIISLNRLTPVNGLFKGVWSWSGYVGIVVLDGSYDRIPEYWNDVARNIPVVIGEADLSKAGGLSDVRIAAINNDFSEGYFRAMTDLMNKGHRCIALLLYESSQIISRRARDGARLATVMWPRGSDVEVRPIYCGAYAANIASERISEQLGMSHPPTAFVLGADDFLPGAQEAFMAASAKMRRSIAVVSVNGVDQVNLKKLGAGSVVFDFDRFGRCCSERLLELMAGQQKQTEAFLSPNFIAGGTIPS